MNFLLNVTGPPLPTAKPIRCGQYHLIATTLGFAVGDPEAFNMPGLAEEAAALPTGSGFVNGRLHLRSRRFPMYFPGSSPKLLLVSPRLAVMPLWSLPSDIREIIGQAIPGDELVNTADAEALMNVLPCFEIHEDGKSLPSHVFASLSK